MKRLHITRINFVFVNAKFDIIHSSNVNQTLQFSSIDLENGVIRGVKEADKGLNKNGYYFNSQLLEDLKNAGNAGNGIKCRFGHPTQGLESLGTYVGRKKNYLVSNNSLYCDIHLDPMSKKTMVHGVSHWDYILEMAENNPDMFGNSVVFLPASVDITEIDGREYPVPTLQEFRASDLVDEPAATNHLFNSENKDIMKNNFFEGVKLAFSEALDKFKEAPKAEELENEVTETLLDGQMVVVETDETDVPKIGDAVTVEGEPAPDGTHETESGLVIVTLGGVISEEPTEVETEEVPAEAVEEQFKAHQADFLKFKEDTKEMIETISSGFSEILEKTKADSEAKDLAFKTMTEKFEASEAKYQVLASSIESPAPLKFNKETLPETKATNAAEEWVASKKEAKQES